MKYNYPPGVCFAILDKTFKRKMEERAAEKGLTAVQLRVLGELRHLEVSGMNEINQRDLENAVSVTHPTMTEIIKRLEKKGAVVCSVSNTDKRYKKISSTPEYSNIHIELEELDRLVFNELCEGLNDEQIEQLMQFFDVMIGNITE
jgi:DNA-binding MarR family transcriptional regulator